MAADPTGIRVVRQRDGISLDSTRDQLEADEIIGVVVGTTMTNRRDRREGVFVGNRSSF